MFGFEKRNRNSDMEVNELAAFLEEQVIPHVQKAARLDERIKLCDEAIAKNKSKVFEENPHEKTCSKALKKLRDLEK